MAAESRLQTKIRKYLTKKKWLVVKIGLCSRPGWPDLCAIKKRTVWIEVKDDKKLDPLQEYRINQIRSYKGEAYKVGTWEEFLSLGL